jgi:hypothetical protein
MLQTNEKGVEARHSFTYYGEYKSNTDRLFSFLFKKRSGLAQMQTFQFIIFRNP